MPADQRLPRNDRRQIVKSNRILKLLRRGFFAIIGLIVLVDGVVILADFQDRYLLASLAKELGVFVSGNTCNIAIGAKLLFWLQLAVELGIVVLTLSLRPTASELMQAQRAWDFQSMRGVPKGLKLLLLVLAFGALFYVVSYGLGYTQRARFHPCTSLTIGQAMHYWYILAVYVARGVMVLTACSLYFDYKATQASRSTRPLT